MKVSMTIVIRDSFGGVIVALCSNKETDFSALLAETKALRRAIQFCVELWFSNVHFEGEASKVIEAVDHHEESWSLYRQWIEDIDPIGL